MNKLTIQKIIATGFGSGYSPVAPGTMGALVATLIWLFLYTCMPFEYLQYITAGCILFFSWLGVWATDALIPEWGDDPSRVVVDEMVGVWIALMGVTQHHFWWQVVAAFVLFRLFDIFKPLGIRRMESLPGGIGVMMDDVLAGIYSLILLVLYNVYSIFLL